MANDNKNWYELNKSKIINKNNTKQIHQADERTQQYVNKGCEVPNIQNYVSKRIVIVG